MDVYNFLLPQNPLNSSCFITALFAETFNAIQETGDGSKSFKVGVDGTWYLWTVELMGHASKT